MDNTQDDVTLRDRLAAVEDFVGRMEAKNLEFLEQDCEPGRERARLDEQLDSYDEASRASQSVIADVADFSKSLRKSRAKAMGPTGRHGIKALEDQAANLGTAMIEELLAIIVQSKYGGLLDGLRELGPNFQQLLLCVENDNLKAKHERVEATLRAELAQTKEQLDAAKLKLAEKDITHQADVEKLKAESEKLKRVSSRSRQVDEVANFLLDHHGRASVGIRPWLPLARTRDTVVAGIPFKGEAAWIVLHSWTGGAGRPEPMPPCQTLLDLVIIGFDRLLGERIDERVCHVIRDLIRRLELAKEAAVEPVVELVRLLVTRFVGLGPSQDCREMLPHLCVFGAWQMLLLIAQRWPKTQSLGEVLGLLEAIYVPGKVVQSVLTLRGVTSGGGTHMKQWVRDAHVEMAEALPRTDFLYLKEQDVVVIDLPTADGFLWLLDLEANTIRMVTANHGKWVTYRALRMGPSDDECFVITTNPERLDWVMKHFRL